MATYTTVPNVRIRLKGWATTEPLAALDDFGATGVDDGLIELLIQRACDRIDQCLASRYNLPLVATHGALSDCAEKLVLCQLIGQLYAGQDPSESGGYGGLMCSQGERQLKALKTLNLNGEVEIGAELASPQSGARSLPSIYKDCCSTDETIKQVRW